MSVDAESSSFWKKLYSVPLDLEEKIGGNFSLLLYGNVWEYNGGPHDEDWCDYSFEVVVECISYDGGKTLGPGLLLKEMDKLVGSFRLDDSCYGI